MGGDERLKTQIITMVTNLIKPLNRIIVCLEQSTVEWANSTSRPIVKQIDPDFSRTSENKMFDLSLIDFEVLSQQFWWIPNLTIVWRNFEMKAQQTPTWRERIFQNMQNLSSSACLWDVTWTAPDFKTPSAKPFWKTMRSFSKSASLRKRIALSLASSEWKCICRSCWMKSTRKHSHQLSKLWRIFATKPKWIWTMLRNNWKNKTLGWKKKVQFPEPTLTRVAFFSFVEFAK